jgi:hypothetical protein
MMQVIVIWFLPDNTSPDALLPTADAAQSEAIIAMTSRRLIRSWNSSAGYMTTTISVAEQIHFA